MIFVIMHTEVYMYIYICIHIYIYIGKPRGAMVDSLLNHPR